MTSVWKTFEEYIWVSQLRRQKTWIIIRESNLACYDVKVSSQHSPPPHFPPSLICRPDCFRLYELLTQLFGILVHLSQSKHLTRLRWWQNKYGLRHIFLSPFCLLWTPWHNIIVIHLCSFINQMAHPLLCWRHIDRSIHCVCCILSSQCFFLLLNV